MKKGIPQYQIKQNFLNAMQNRKSMADLGTSLKNWDDKTFAYNTLNDLIKNLPIMEKMVYGNLFPKTVCDLGCGVRYFYKPESLDNEIDWLLNLFKNHIDEICVFISIRDRFENYFLQGKFDKAMAVLEEGKTLGQSIWYYEMKTLLYSYMGRMSEAVKMITELNLERKGVKYGFVPLMLWYIYRRSQINLSAYAYDYDLISLFKQNKNDWYVDRNTYFLFRLNYYENYDYTNLGEMMQMESTNSLIDRYLFFQMILKSAMCNENVNKRGLAKKVLKLYNKALDKRLLPFVAVDVTEPLPEEYYDSKFVHILDAYYSARYEEVVSEVQAYIIHNPSNFDVIKLYCRALLFLGHGYVKITPDSSSLVNELSFYVYQVVSGNNSEDYLYKLYQMSKNFAGLYITGPLDYFIKEERNEKREEKLHLLSMNYFDPLFTKIYEHKADKLKYLNNASQRFTNSVVINYQKSRVQRKISDINVVGYIREVDNAKISFENGNYDNSLLEWNIVLKKYHNTLPIAQTAVEYIYKCYVRKSLYKDAIDFYIDSYIDNNLKVLKVDTKDLEKVLWKNKFKKMRLTLNYLLFILLNNFENDEKNYALEMYCDYMEATSPADLIDELKNEDPRKIEVFFYILFNTDIIRHYKTLGSRPAVLEEKDRIIKYLVSINSIHHDEYIKKNIELAEEMEAYQVIKKLDESKIYANVPAIMMYELEGAESIYEKFKSQFEMMKTGEVYYMVDDSEPIDLKKDSSQKEVSVYKATFKFSDNAIEEAACEIFDIIRHDFLKSKFGLGTYLSTRIRHGVFEGELRSELSKLHIILNLEKKKYVPTLHWQSIYMFDPDIQTKLMGYLAEFSKGVDSLIFGFKSKVLQIRLEEKETGSFNYILSKSVISEEELRIFSKSANYQEFCENTINWLWEITDDNLEKIREEIRESLAGDFNKLFDELEINVGAFQNQHFYHDLTSAISDGRTAIAKKLKKIEGWFYIQDAKVDDHLLQKLIDIEWDKTCREFPFVKYELIKENVPNVVIKSEYVANFMDLLYHFFSNMFKYSKQEMHRVALFESSIENDILKMRFVNEVDGKEEDINDSVNNSMMPKQRLQSEGKSGYEKALNIVKYEFKCEENSIVAGASGNKFVAEVVINLSGLSK
jgi:hypothetical protein